jgi:hypothetical protein
MISNTTSHKKQSKDTSQTYIWRPNNRDFEGKGGKSGAWGVGVSVGAKWLCWLADGTSSSPTETTRRRLEEGVGAIVMGGIMCVSSFDDL